MSLAFEIIALMCLGASLGLALGLGAWAACALIWGLAVDG